MPRRNPLESLKTSTDLVFFVPKPGAASTSIAGVQSYAAGVDTLDKLAYSVYLSGAVRNPFEYFGLQQSEIPLTGFLLNPLHIDSRIAIGTQVPGFFQSTAGYFKRVFCDKGISIVSDIIGDRVAFIFAAQAIDFDMTLDC
jgi:hypothetical protein